MKCNFGAMTFLMIAGSIPTMGHAQFFETPLFAQTSKLGIVSKPLYHVSSGRAFRWKTEPMLDTFPPHHVCQLPKFLLWNDNFYVKFVKDPKAHIYITRKSRPFYFGYTPGASAVKLTHTEGERSENGVRFNALTASFAKIVGSNNWGAAKLKAEQSKAHVAATRNLTSYGALEKTLKPKLNKLLSALSVNSFNWRSWRETIEQSRSLEITGVDAMKGKEAVGVTVYAKEFYEVYYRGVFELNPDRATMKFNDYAKTCPIEGEYRFVLDWKSLGYIAEVSPSHESYYVFTRGNDPLPTDNAFFYF